MENMRKHVYPKSMLNCKILVSQREQIDDLIKHVNEEYGTKLTLADVVREALEAGLPIAKETRNKWAIAYL